MENKNNYAYTLFDPRLVLPAAVSNRRVVDYALRRGGPLCGIELGGHSQLAQLCQQQLDQVPTPDHESSVAIEALRFFAYDYLSLPGQNAVLVASVANVNTLGLMAGLTLLADGVAVDDEFWQRVDQIVALARWQDEGTPLGRPEPEISAELSVLQTVARDGNVLLEGRVRMIADWLSEGWVPMFVCQIAERQRVG